MPSPTQSNTPLARIQPVKQELPSLEQMRADLLALEMNDKDPLVKMLAGSQRTIVDHLRLMVAGQRMQGQAFKKYVDDKADALAGEVNAAFASLGEQPQPETDVAPSPATAWQGPKEETQAVTIETVVTQPPATPAPVPSTDAPRMTVTPVVRTGRAQRQAAQKAGAK